MNDRLTQIEEVAHAADNGSSWEWEHAYPQRITRIGDTVLVADCFEDPDSPPRFAEFIATFDPPTVLALVEIAKAARLVQAFDQAGGDDWWGAHAQLYRALSVLDDREET